jgi:hypothetical protein
VQYLFNKRIFHLDDPVVKSPMPDATKLYYYLTLSQTEPNTMKLVKLENWNTHCLRISFVGCGWVPHGLSKAMNLGDVIGNFLPGEVELSRKNYSLLKIEPIERSN